MIKISTIVRYLPMLMFILLLFGSCSQNENESQKDGATAINLDTNRKFRVNVVDLSHSPGYDSLYCDVKITNNGKKVPFGLFNLQNITIKETGYDSSNFAKPASLEYLGGKNVIGNRSIIVLMDISASIGEDEIRKQQDAVAEFQKMLPNNKIYYSLMDESVSPSKLFTKNSLQFDLKKALIGERTDKNLYNAILLKIEENEKLSDTLPKMLFIFTDGKVNSGVEFIGGGEKFFEDKIKFLDQIREKERKKEMLPIHCIYFGDSTKVDEIADDMEMICNRGTENEIKGKFHRAYSADSIRAIIFNTIEGISADYRLVLHNDPGKEYDGHPNTLQIWITIDNERKAYGEIDYTFFSKMNPFTVSEVTRESKKDWSAIGVGLLFGALLIALVYLIFQFLIPFISYRNFRRKYVVPYTRSSSVGGDNTVVEERCYFCRSKFENGDTIVKKCKHIVHVECWEENRNRCPEYGSKNCSTGIHYYNRKQLTDDRNSSHYLLWILYGLTGGILSWLFFKIIITNELFGGLISPLVNALYLDQAADTPIGGNIMGQFQAKIQTFLLSGLLLGFFLTFLFSYFIEFRKKTIKVISKLLIRSLLSSLLGFVTFLLGSMVIILVGKSSSCLWIDWVPWLFFATGMAFIVSFKTEIKFKNAFIGATISVLFSFVVLYLATFATVIVGMFSYMFFAAGLGTAIAMVHFISEKYFLHAVGPMKERDIAIYKWMNVSGGFNKVSIGKSIDCVIQINWDAKGTIADKQIELYNENDRPYFKALEEGTTLSNGRAIKKGEVIHLTHGITFIIGNTKFTYIEKDK